MTPDQISMGQISMGEIPMSPIPTGMTKPTQAATGIGRRLVVAILVGIGVAAGLGRVILDGVIGAEANRVTLVAATLALASSLAAGGLTLALARRSAHAMLTGLMAGMLLRFATVVGAILVVGLIGEVIAITELLAFALLLLALVLIGLATEVVVFLSSPLVANPTRAAPSPVEPAMSDETAHASTSADPIPTRPPQPPLQPPEHPERGNHSRC